MPPTCPPTVSNVESVIDIIVICLEVITPCLQNIPILVRIEALTFKSATSKLNVVWHLETRYEDSASLVASYVPELAILEDKVVIRDCIGEYI